MKIGIAIPCYNKHIPNLLNLLKCIDNQTRKPDMVSISCSSTRPEEFPEHIELLYSFPIHVILRTERTNSATNRNIAAKHLNTDIISFYDADDIMHPQRIEALEYTFKEPCDIAVHSCLIGDECLKPFKAITNFEIKRNELRVCYSGCLIMRDNLRITHGHVTVSKHIFDRIKFPEDLIYEGKEDCIFCNRILQIENIRTAYINHHLTKYIQSNSFTK